MEMLLGYVVVIILGLVVGSFLNVVIYRLPLMLQRQWREQCLQYLERGTEDEPQKYFNLCWPASHCPHCQKKLAIWQNIPLFSYLFLRGRCYYCQAKIAWHYPIVELISALLAFLVVWRFGFTWQAIAAVIFSWGLLVLFFIDLFHQILPDEITLGLLWLGLLVNTYNVFTTPENAIIGAITGYSSLWLVGWLYKKARKIEGMGYGDYKLFATAGAWLGWQPLAMILFFSAVMGLIVGIYLLARKKMHHTTPMPYGPYLVIAMWIILMSGKTNLFFWQ